MNDNEIVIGDENIAEFGRFEVHPGRGNWIVIDSRTGHECCSFQDREDAMDRAAELAEEDEEMDATEKVYVVVDASDEYLDSNGDRTPCSDRAQEFETRAEAKAACDRITDRVVETDPN